MPAQQGTLNLLDNAVFAVVAVPVSALRPGSDVDGDGRMSATELQAPGLALELQQRLRLLDATQPRRIDFFQLSAEADEQSPASAAGGRHFILLAKFSFETPPAALRVETDLFGKTAAEQQLTLKATRGKESEVVVLGPHRTQHRLFRSTLQVATDALAMGAEHVLLGADHLLFLLTVMAAAAGWRYWLVVLTSFTVAHSLTLFGALLGGLRAPPEVVEPLIAASIVLMALMNLSQRRAQVGLRVALVFGCGLLHGLGFASAIAAFGLDGRSMFVNVLAFNVGIELGQAVFVAVMLGLWVGLRRLSLRTGSAGFDAARAARLGNGLALLIGAVWVVQRVSA